MKIAIITGLPAKRYVDINAAHLLNYQVDELIVYKVGTSIDSITFQLINFSTR